MYAKTASIRIIYYIIYYIIAYETLPIKHSAHNIENNKNDDSQFGQDIIADNDPRRKVPSHHFHHKSSEFVCRQIVIHFLFLAFLTSIETIRISNLPA